MSISTAHMAGECINTILQSGDSPSEVKNTDFLSQTFQYDFKWNLESPHASLKERSNRKQLEKLTFSSSYQTQEPSPFFIFPNKT